jgi:flagellar basal body-associated protein FliL
MWLRLFNRFGMHKGKLSLWGILIILIFVSLLVLGIYLLLNGS